MNTELNIRSTMESKSLSVCRVKNTNQEKLSQPTADHHGEHSLQSDGVGATWLVKEDHMDSDVCIKMP
jgi:hypothetical protein